MESPPTSYQENGPSYQNKKSKLSYGVPNASHIIMFVRHLKEKLLESDVIRQDCIDWHTPLWEVSLLQEIVKGIHFLNLVFYHTGLDKVIFYCFHYCNDLPFPLPIKIYASLHVNLRNWRCLSTREQM